MKLQHFFNLVSPEFSLYLFLNYSLYREGSVRVEIGLR